MPESYLRQSALAGLGLQGRAQAERGIAGVAMREIPFLGLIDLRGKAEKDFLAGAGKALGFALPETLLTTASQDGKTVLRLGPDQWWIVTSERDAGLAGSLRDALAGQRFAVTDIGDSRTCIRVSGPQARALLEKGCPLDLHPRSFQAGRCAQSLLSKADITLIQRDEAPSYDLFVLCSFAEYVWMWLEDAAQEYGVALLAD